MTVEQFIKIIQDLMRKDAGIDGDAQRLSQVCWLLFLKLFDDIEYSTEQENENYISPLKEEYRWRNWTKRKELQGSDLIEFVNKNLLPYLESLDPEANKQNKIIHSVFSGVYNFMRSGALLKQVIERIDQVDLKPKSNSRHEINVMYESFLQGLQSAGNSGEFYTPRAVTSFMVQMVNPEYGQKILDPACGTGGFLVDIIEFLREQNESIDNDVLQETIFGFDKKPLPYQLCITNLMLHGLQTPYNIINDNTLSLYNEDNKYKYIITNPPFGGQEEDGVEKEFPLGYRTRETADLFLKYLMDHMEENGKAAIVLPDGFLFGEGNKTTLKKDLLKDFNLHTIVRLPNGVFSPYTGIKTNLLFFDKEQPTQDIWYFEHPLPEGINNYSRTNPLSIDEFNKFEKKWWKDKENKEFIKYAWKVSIDEIKDKNYNLDISNPYQNIVNFKSPEELLKDYLNLLQDIAEKQKELKSELASIIKK